MTDQRTILIVEDEQFLSEMYRTKFESLGYKVLTAETGEDGMKKMREARPTIVLLDVIMPVMDGYEVLRRVRADKQLRDQLIVVFSNLGQDEEVTKGMQMGADAYLVKSNLTPAQLVEKIEQVLKQGRLHTIRPADIRVLLLTEDESLANSLRPRFEKEGFQQRIIENIGYGLKSAQSEPYDVVVYDSGMVGMESKEVVKTLKRTPKLHDIPVLLLTEDSSEDFSTMMKQVGVEQVYLKPRLTASQLVNSIRALVDRSRH